MGVLTNDMTRLRDDIDALHNSRGAFINDLMHNVAEMQSNFRNDHAEMASKTKDDLSTFVSNLKENVVQMHETFRDAHAEMSRELRQTFDDNEAKRMQESMDSHGQRITEITDRKRKVDETLADFRNTHAEMASKTKDDLSTFVTGLKGSVADLLQQVAADIEGAHQAWFGQAPRERTTKKETKRKFREEEIKVEPEKPEELIPDDLTEIQGIGLSRQEILNEAGFYTFAQFAKSTPEDLKRALGEMSKFVDVEKWIEQAKELVEPE